MRFFEGYRCGDCAREVPAGSVAGECPSCGGPLLGRYDLGLLRSSVVRDELLGSGRGVWRFGHLLPDLGVELTLGEGGTPLLDCPRLAERAGLDRLWIKDESSNPTGSFKARGMAVAVSRVVDLGMSRACVPSAGNAALALSAYSAAAGIGARIYLPTRTPVGVAEECRAYGAEVVVEGETLPEAAARMEADRPADSGFCVLSTFREPCRVEGKKTIAFEIEAELGHAPDWIVFPTGGGTGIVALWKAYRELEELGWLEGARPRLAVVQSEGCAPIVRAFEAGGERLEPWDSPETVASGIRVPGSRAGSIILEALRDTGGAAVAVPDGETVEAASMMASLAGVFPSPEGAACLAGAMRMASSGTIAPGDEVVVVNTAGWSRYRFMLEPFSD